MKISKAEQELLESVEQGEWRQISDYRQEMKCLADSATATIRKDKRVNIA